MESVKLHLAMQDIGRILQILSKQPYDQVADVIEKMKVQVQMHVVEQRAPAQGVQAGEPHVNGVEAG